MRLEGIVPKRIDYDLRPGFSTRPYPNAGAGSHRTEVYATLIFKLVSLLVQENDRFNSDAWSLQAGH